MKRNSILVQFILLFSIAELSAQVTGPWQRPLIICNSNNGVNFFNFQTFQDSSGVPSMIRDTSGRLIAAFQWFPAPFQGAHWDSVALKYSYDNGITWTFPQTLYINNFPAGYQRIFDPALCLNPDGSIRIYFSSNPPGGIISTYSAISPDGINFNFEPGIRFTRTTIPTIDPTVIYFNGMFHYSAPKGAPQDGALHATSIDGLNFTQQPDIPSDFQHNWTGNFMIDSLAIKFYGTPAMNGNLWFKDSPDAFTWNPNFTNTTVQGGDPTCIKVNSGNYLMIYTGPPNTTNIVENKNENFFSVYPNPFSDELTISGANVTGTFPKEIKVFDVFGREIFFVFLQSPSANIRLKTSGVPNGIYFVKSDDKVLKIIK